MLLCKSTWRVGGLVRQARTAINWNQIESCDLQTPLPRAYTIDPLHLTRKMFSKLWCPLKKLSLEVNEMRITPWSARSNRSIQPMMGLLFERNWVALSKGERSKRQLLNIVGKSRRRAKARNVSFVIKSRRNQLIRFVVLIKISFHLICCNWISNSYSFHHPFMSIINFDFLFRSIDYLNFFYFGLVGQMAFSFYNMPCV